MAYAVGHNARMGMSEVQELLSALKAKGWTYAAIADEIGVTSDAVEKWKGGLRQPSNRKITSIALTALLEKKHVPKQRRYRKAP